MIFSIKFLVFFLTCSIASLYANSIQRLTKDIKNVKNGNIWVVLVAGSNGYLNYRHQADVLHAYQLVHKYNKVPKERIITFMYDDIAYSKSNPFPGNVINYPNGENLYTDDLEKDYTGQEVTTENFIGVLLKDQNLINQNKKVLNSTSEDFVFIYFSDHGAPSLIAFPRGVLSALDFKAALDKMKEQNSYNKMTIYVEACESGSMFESDTTKLNDNVYAVTASNDMESSWAAYFDEKRATYLADEFSINWLLDSFASEGKEETLYTQFLHTKEKTKRSHVCQFGDLDMAKKFNISEFQGEEESNKFLLNKIEKIKSISQLPKNLIRNDEVEFYLTKIHSEMKNDDSFARVLEGRKVLKKFMKNLQIRFASKLNVKKNELTGKAKSKNLKCYDEIIKYLHNNCISLNGHTYLYKHLYLFVNACNLIDESNNVLVSDLIQIISNQCSTLKYYFNQLSNVV